MKYIVSACLLGENCKYNGGNNYCQEVVDYLQGKEVIPVCPELQAGMGCPRTPIEIVRGVLMDREGNNVDAPMRKAIGEILEQLEDAQIGCAILKSRSPTCGVKQVYDGTFSGKLVPGAGLFAQALQAVGIPVVDSEDVETL